MEIRLLAQVVQDVLQLGFEACPPELALFACDGHALCDRGENDAYAVLLLQQGLEETLVCHEYPLSRLPEHLGQLLVVRWQLRVTIDRVILRFSEIDHVGILLYLFFHIVLFLFLLL